MYCHNIRNDDTTDTASTAGPVSENVHARTQMSNLGMAPSPTDTKDHSAFRAALGATYALPGVRVGIQDLHMLVLAADFCLVGLPVIILVIAMSSLTTCTLAGVVLRKERVLRSRELHCISIPHAKVSLPIHLLRATYSSTRSQITSRVQAPGNLRKQPASSRRRSRTAAIMRLGAYLVVWTHVPASCSVCVPAQQTAFSHEISKLRCRPYLGAFPPCTYNVIHTGLNRDSFQAQVSIPFSWLNAVCFILMTISLFAALAV